MVEEQQRSVTSRVRAAVVWNYVGAVVRIALSFSVQLVYIRLLGPASMGQFAVFMLFVGLGSILADGGFGAALVRVAEANLSDFRIGLTWLAGFAIVVCLSLWTSSAFLLHFIFPTAGRNLEDMVKAAATAILPQALSSIPLSVLKRRFAARSIQLIQSVSYGASFLLVGLPFAVRLHSAWAPIGAFILQAYLTLVAAWALARPPVIPKLGWSSSIQSFGLRASLSNILLFSNDSADNALIGRFFGAHALGVYSTSFNVCRAPTDALASSMHGPLFAGASIDEARKGDAASRTLYMVHFIMTFLAPSFVFVSLQPALIVDFLLGPKWHDATFVLGGVSMAMLGRLLSSAIVPLLWGWNRVAADIRSQLFMLAYMVVGLTCIKDLTVGEASIIVASAYWFRLTLQVVSFQRISGILPKTLLLPMLRPMLGAVIVPAGAVWVSRTLTHASSAHGQIPLAFLLYLSFWGVYALWSTRSSRYRDSCDRILQLLGRRMRRSSVSGAAL